MHDLPDAHASASMLGQERQASTPSLDCLQQPVFPFVPFDPSPFLAPFNNFDPQLYLNESPDIVPFDAQLYLQSLPPDPFSPHL